MPNCIELIHVTYLAAASGHCTLDAKHLPECIFITVLDLKVVPFFPELWMRVWISIVGGVDINSPGTVDFSKISFKFRKLHAHYHDIFVWEARFYSLLQRCQETQEQS